MTLSFSPPTKLRIMAVAKKTDRWYSKHYGEWFDILPEKEIKKSREQVITEYKVLAPCGHEDTVSRDHCKTDTDYAIDKFWRNAKKVEKETGMKIFY